tara:strand:- start:269 stop:544 length:276 start_codon:yes stop_codon:yes gene_type:complete
LFKDDDSISQGNKETKRKKKMKKLTTTVTDCEGNKCEITFVYESVLPPKQTVKILPSGEQDSADSKEIVKLKQEIENLKTCWKISLENQKV